MEPLLIYFDESKYNSDVRSLKAHAEHCQGIIASFQKMGFGKFEQKDLKKLIFETENYLFEKIMEGRPLEVAGMKVNKKKMFDLLEKPDGYYVVIKKVQDFLSIVESSIKYKDLNMTAEHYLVKSFEFKDESLELDVKESIIESLKTKYQEYAKTPKAQLAYKFATELAELINESDAFKKVGEVVNQNSVNYFIHNIIDVDWGTRKVSVRIQGIKNYDN